MVAKQAVSGDLQIFLMTSLLIAVSSIVITLCLARLRVSKFQERKLLKLPSNRTDTTVLADIEQLFTQRGKSMYTGEPVTQTEHALQVFDVGLGLQQIG